MQHTTEDFARWRDFAITIAAEAAEKAKTMVRAGFTADTKSNGTIVTDVDRSVEQYLRGRINETYPDHAVLGEEFGLTGTVSPDVPLWCLDPVDGTTNLANGLPLWCISVGVVYGNQSVAGAINAPMLNEVYAAAVGQGATRNGEPLPKLHDGGELGPEEVYIICSTTARRMNFSRLTAKLRILGSAALDLCFVAAGQAKGTQCACTSLYDLAAGMCITQEVGAETIWLESGDAYQPMPHLEAGSNCDITLVTAPPSTLRYVRERLG